MQHEASALEQKLAVTAVERRSTEELMTVMEERLREDLQFLSSREEAADARCADMRQAMETAEHERRQLHEELAIASAECRRLTELQPRLEVALAGRAAAEAVAAHYETTGAEARAAKASAEAAEAAARGELHVMSGRLAQMEAVLRSREGELQAQLQAALSKMAARSGAREATTAEQERLRKEAAEAEARCVEWRQQAENGKRERQQAQKQLAVVLSEKGRLEATNADLHGRLEKALAARAAAQECLGWAHMRACGAVCGVSVCVRACVRRGVRCVCVRACERASPLPCATLPARARAWASSCLSSRRAGRDPSATLLAPLPPARPTPPHRRLPPVRTPP